MALEGLTQIPATRTRVIVCATVIEEMVPPLPPDVDYHVLDFDLRVNPEALKKRALQEAVGAWATSGGMIFMGYGPCSQAVVGRQASDCAPVVPKVDDRLERYRDYSRRTAERFGPRLRRDPRFQYPDQKDAARSWDNEFVVARPGATTSYLDFKRTKCQT